MSEIELLRIELTKTAEQLARRPISKQEQYALFAAYDAAPGSGPRKVKEAINTVFGINLYDLPEPFQKSAASDQIQMSLQMLKLIAAQTTPGRR